MKKELTVEQGVEIQKQQLAKWQFLLKPEIFEYLKEKAVEKNHIAKTGYDICRGSDLDNIVSNYCYYNNIKTAVVEISAKFPEKDGGQFFNFTEYVCEKHSDKALEIAIENFKKSIEKTDLSFVNAKFKL